jgi:hypothetical protein
MLSQTLYIYTDHITHVYVHGLRFTDKDVLLFDVYSFYMKHMKEKIYI